MTNIHKAALWYAKQKNWFVVVLHAPIFSNDGKLTGCTCEAWRQRKHPSFKCETPGKHPILTGWELEATNNSETINEWWRRFPWANVGIAAGKSGLLTFDNDSYKDNYEGEKILTKEDEETVTSLSGGGGSHLIYGINDDDYYGNAKGTLPQGIDIRCHGGQFVAPPSIHPSGRRYQWESGYGPHEISPLPLPVTIRSILDTQRLQQSQSVTFTEDVPPPNVDHLRIKAEIAKLIHEPPVRGGRSEADQSVITALVWAGATNEEIKAIFQFYPIGKQGKFAEKGNNAMNYLTRSIAHARTWVSNRQEEVAEQNTGKFLVALAG